jgi:hypothetical protein
MKSKVSAYDLLEERLTGRDKALELQAKEYERRLDALNGEAGKLHNMQEQYISREVFERTVTSLQDKIYILTTYKNAQEGKSDLTKYIPYIIAIGAIIFAYIKK